MFDVSLRFHHPQGNVFEAGVAGDIVHEQHADRIPVVGFNDRTEPLLTGGIPQLQLDTGAILHLDQMSKQTPTIGSDSKANLPSVKYLTMTISRQ